MSQMATIVLSLLITLGVLGAITGFVSSRVRRSSSASTREATRPEVSFIVCARRWQSLMLRGAGILFIVVGVLCLVIGIVDPESLGTAIPGVVIAIVGLLFLWLARGLARARLEVTADSIWVFPWTGAPREVPLATISRLGAMASSNYGGLVAHVEHGRSVSANRTMLGYPQLIDYFQTRRPDLSIPDASWPL